MVSRKFYTYSETCDRVNDAETVRQAIIVGHLPAYIELKDATCTVHSRDGTFPADGSSAFANWFGCSFLDEPPTVIGDGPLKGWFEQDYILRGWFRVVDDSAVSVARMHDDRLRLVDIIAERGDGSTSRFHPTQHIHFHNLWFSASDVERLSAPTPARGGRDDKPLGTRERTTLLRIIGALAAHAKLDLSQPMKAGEAVAAMLPSDVTLSARTIGEHLKAVREAMDSRKG